MRLACRDLLVGLLIVVLTSAVSWAQFGTAQISGAVRDESGGVLPGASVTVTQTDTGFTRSVVTDAAGAYVLPDLPVGPYRLDVSIPGFRSYQRTGIVLQVGSAPVINVVLAIGAVEETVTVQAASPLVDVQSAGIGAVVENERIVALPLNGRNAAELIALAGAAIQPPGFLGEASTRSMPGGLGIAVAGGQPWGIGYQLDGAVHNNPYDNFNLPLPFPDALQEFKVETSALAAQHGMHSGASVNAVTRSGTNVFHGDLFEFFRHHELNATHPFAARGADGKRKSDGLKRNQFGGTLGGPIKSDRLFFFGAHQSTLVRQTLPDNIGFVPTAAMLAGDFTAFASPACNRGQQITLRAPFVSNRIDPARFSPAGLALARRLPPTDDPCGRLVYSTVEDVTEHQTIGKIDFQWSANHSLFGRYMATSHFNPPAFDRSDNVLTTSNSGRDNLAQSVTIGDTYLFNSQTVNSFRVAFNRTAIHRTAKNFFSAPELGVNSFSYLPHFVHMTVSGAFSLGGPTQNDATFNNNMFSVSDNLTLVRGGHQLSFGGHLAWWESISRADARSPGIFIFNGSVTGRSLADLLTGNLFLFIQSAPNLLDMSQWSTGLYAQDAWRATDRLTLNLGLRWEPMLPQQLRNGAIYNFSLDRFRRGLKSTVFPNAPAGFTYPGDSGFPNGKAGINKRWNQLAPRVGLAWDVTGDGQTSVRSSYGIAYDFVNAQYHLNTANAPPWGSEVRIVRPRGGFDSPFAGVPGGNPFPSTVGDFFPLFGSFLVVNPNQKTATVHSWNLVLEQQLAPNWAAQIGYLGRYTTNLWDMKALNPGVFLGLGPCTLPDGRTYNPCSQDGNLNQRRRLLLENPTEGRFIGFMDEHDDAGWERYHGLLLSVQRRVARGLFVNGNYTWSHCEGLQNSVLPNVGTGWLDPENPSFDRGHCVVDGHHIFNLTVGAETPRFADPALRAIASGWRVSGILRALSGGFFTVTIDQDAAKTGISDQRPNKVLDNVYGGKTIDDYLNPRAFAVPALGTLGNLGWNSIEGPGRWQIDLSLVRLFRLGPGEGHRLEFRAEAFNLTNNIIRNDPVAALSSSVFGQIIGADDPRILQFAVKYAF
jgi:hypothetical protein